MSINLDIGSGSGFSGPTNFNTSSCNMMMNNVAGYGGGEPVDVRRKLMQQQQPFDISTTFCGSVSKSPGGMASAAADASMGFFPFTNAQWKELERQAMVFKYMMHSIPVPYELLFPFITATNPPGIGRDAHLLKFLKNGDPEPGRCRRTDGKKWRCSNAVALDQKYCEKHVHRGRPRSRKHVEAATDLRKNNKRPCLAHNQSNAATASAAAVSVSKPILTTQTGAKLDPDQLSRSTAGYNINSNAAFQLPLGNMASIASHCPQSHLRNGDLSEEEWHQLMQFKSGHTSNLSTYSNTSLFQPLSLNSYTPFSPPSQDTQPKPEFNLFLHANLKRPATSLIDASWTVNGNKTTDNNSHDLVSLGLSMGHHDYGDGESENKQTRIGNWMTQSGGPLGEVLRPTGTHTIPPPGSSSPTTATGVEDSCNNNSPQMSSSSASGVLQKAVASLSDSTRHSNSDPKTRFPSQSKSGFQWLNQEQDKLLQQSF